MSDNQFGLNSRYRQTLRQARFRKAAESANSVIAAVVLACLFVMTLVGVLTK